MLIPISLMGYEKALLKLNGIKLENIAKFNNCNKCYLFVTLFVLAISVIGYSKWGQHCLTEQNEVYAAYTDSWYQPYTTEGPVDIAQMKADKEYAEGMMVFLNHLLDINGIKY